MLCHDALLRDGLLSLIEGIRTVSIVPGDGRIRGVADALRSGNLDAVIVPLDAVEAGELAQLGALKVGRKPRIIGISSAKGSTPAFHPILESVVPRSAGADGLRHVLHALRPSDGVPVGVREAAPFYLPGPKLTRREQQVAQLISRGLSNRRIADTLGIREQSVKNLVSVLLRKLECENRVQVALHLTRRESLTSSL